MRERGRGKEEKERRPFDRVAVRDGLMDAQFRNHKILFASLRTVLKRSI